MKINGKKIENSNVEIIILPRGDGNDIVFKASAILDMDDFDKLCPLPEPPKVMRKGGFVSTNVEDPSYKAALLEHGKKRLAWMVLKSLQATEGLEWETVDMSNPDTWTNYEKEMRAAKFSQPEINRITQGVMNANCLNEDLIDEARKRFLANQQEVLEK